MRIIGGAFRGLKLAELGAGDSAAHLRPTTDRIRESIFNLLMNGKHGKAVSGARVLDLFAGTGAMGLEAVSRGALFATFVDNGNKAIELLTENIRRTRTKSQVEIIRRDACEPGQNKAAPYDLIFMDPPYDLRLGEAAIVASKAGNWLAPGAILVWEEAGVPTIPTFLRLLDKRRYGSSNICILQVITTNS